MSCRQRLSNQSSTTTTLSKSTIAGCRPLNRNPTNRLLNPISHTTIGRSMSSAPFTTNPLDDQSDSAQAPLFENASKAEISDDVEIAFDQLTIVRDVYDDEVLRELATLLPFEVAKDNQSVLLERQNDGSFF